MQQYVLCTTIIKLHYINSATNGKIHYSITETAHFKRWLGSMYQKYCTSVWDFANHIIMISLNHTRLRIAKWKWLLNHSSKNSQIQKPIAKQCSCKKEGDDPYIVNKSRQAICAIFQFIWMERTCIWRTVNSSVKVHDSLSLSHTCKDRARESCIIC